jgi:hypothetical protein
MKTYGGVEVQLHALTSAVGGDGRLASRPGRFTPGVRTPCTHWIEGWMGPRAGLDAVAKEEPITAPAANLTPISQPVA